MTQFIITYDLEKTDPSPYQDVLDAAEKEGLLYVLHAGSHLHRLPNTTLWGNFSDYKAALEAFNRAVKDAEKAIGRKIAVEKILVAGAPKWVRSDVKKAPQKQWVGANTFETCRLHQLNDPDFR